MSKTKEGRRTVVEYVGIPHVRKLIELVGEDPDREGLEETPARYVRALKEWCSGYHQDAASVLKCFEDGAQGYDEMILQKDIPFYSLCEHHMAPFFGTVHIGYIPDGRIVGLSKLARVTDVFARRLQVQERMTSQIADALHENLKPKGVGVVVCARHLCIESRGIKKPGTITMTNALRGVLRKPSAKAEFLGLAGV